MTHEIVQFLIAFTAISAFFWCWWHSHGIKKHAAIAVIFITLFFAWQYHAYFITWLHLSPEPLIQDELPDAHGMHHGEH